jgi:hypothetical protein
MPPEKRGLISNTTGSPLTTRHWYRWRRPAWLASRFGELNSTCDREPSGRDDDAARTTTARGTMEMVDDGSPQNINGES